MSAIEPQTREKMSDLSPALEPDRSGRARQARRWLFRYRFEILAGLVLALHFLLIRFGEYTPAVKLKSGEEGEDILMIMQNVQVNVPSLAPDPGAGELSYEEKQIKQAKNPFMIKASMPIDLNPSDKPVFPTAAKKAGVSGILFLQVVISDKGTVVAAKVLKKIGYGMEAAALKWIKNKKFHPALVDGQPISVKMMIPVKFELY